MESLSDGKTKRRKNKRTTNLKKFLINVPGLSLLLFAGLFAEAAATAVETARAAVGLAAARAAAVELDPRQCIDSNTKREKTH